MDKDQAIHEVQEIKRVMEESHKRSSRGKYWIIPVLAIVAMIAAALVPFLAPVIGIGLLVAGVIVWRRNNEPIMKVIAGGIVAIGIVLLLMTLFVVLGLIAYHASTVTPGPVKVIPVPVPAS